tara:strand:- start:611 stop:781 length:171 start_codon:yes stop_codon:yes gene_type:complete
VLTDTKLVKEVICIEKKCVEAKAERFLVKQLKKSIKKTTLNQCVEVIESKCHVITL